MGKISDNLSRIETYLADKYDFKYNNVLDKISYKKRSCNEYVHLDSYSLNSLVRELKKEDIPIFKNDLLDILKSDFILSEDPFFSFFESLPEWNPEMPDYINELSATVTVADEDVPLWQTYFKRWLVACVACALDPKDVNHQVLVFIGAQGVGKTTWMNKLVPQQLEEYYYSGEVNPNSKDSRINLSECFLVNLDELENLTKGSQGALKNMISLPSIKLRRPYAAVEESMRRRCSFMGSVNTREFLKDNTGNRRYLCVEPLAINFQHNLNVAFAYAQAFYHFKNRDIDWFFSPAESTEISNRNEMFRYVSVELDLINEYFTPSPPNTEADMYLTVAELQKELLKRGQITFNLNLKALGSALKNSTYMVSRDNRGRRVWRLNVRKAIEPEDKLDTPQTSVLAQREAFRKKRQAALDKQNKKNM